MKTKSFPKRVGARAALVLVPGFLLSCATRLPIPVLGDRDRVSQEWPSIQLEDLRQGRKMYLENCAGCHSMYLPSEFTGAAWQRILERMQPKTRLTDGQTEAVLGYLTAFAKSTSREKAEAR